MDKDSTKALLRISFSLIFLYFGFSQLTNIAGWAYLVPDFMNGQIASANNWVVINAIFELTFGIFLMFGIYTKVTSFLLFLHLTFITISLGFVPTGVRDFGLTIATLVIFLNGTDKYCVDEIMKKA